MSSLSDKSFSDNVSPKSMSMSSPAEILTIESSAAVPTAGQGTPSFTSTDYGAQVPTIVYQLHRPNIA